MDSKSQVYHERFNTELIMSSLDVDERMHGPNDDDDETSTNNYDRNNMDSELIRPASSLSTRQRQVIFKRPEEREATGSEKSKATLTQSGLLKKVYDHLGILLSRACCFSHADVR